LASPISIFDFELVRTAAEFARLKSAIARLEKELECTSIELVLAVAGFRREFILLTMFCGAGLFILGGLYGLPDFERRLSGIGSRKEHVTRRKTISGLV
jgi:hypothetical protein